MISSLEKLLKSIYQFEILSNRSKLLLKNVLISVFLKSIILLSSFFLVSKSLKLVGPNDYGLWIAINSFVNILNFLDLGFGNGLKNRLAETHTSNKFKLGIIYVSTTFGVIIFFSVIIFLISLLLNLLIDWSEFFNLSNYSNEFIQTLILITVSFFCLTFIFQVVNSILIALHISYFILIIDFLASFISLVLLNIFESNVSGSLLNLIFILVGVPIIIKTCSCVYLFKTKLKTYNPKFKFIRVQFINDLFSLGGVFFLLQVGSIVLFQTDNVLISYLFGVSEVVPFNLTFKLFSVLIVLTSLLMTPLWTAFTEAYVQQDFVWIGIVFRKILVMWTLGIFCSLGLLIFSPFIFDFWLDRSIVIPWSLSFSICIYVLFHCLMVIVCTLLNGIGKIKLQLLIYFFIVIINIPMSIFLSSFWGVPGIIWSNSICVGCASIILLIQTNKIISHTATGIWNL